MTETKEKQTTLTSGQVLSEKIHLGGTEEKHSRRYNYLSTQVLYDNKPFILKERGKMKIFSFNKKSFSVGLAIDEQNKDYFESIEKKITELYDSVELKLIKSTNDYLKIYLKLFHEMGKFTPHSGFLKGIKRDWLNLLIMLGYLSLGKNFLISPEFMMGIVYL